jgi:hypothetical protein
MISMCLPNDGSIPVGKKNGTDYSVNLIGGSSRQSGMQPEGVPHRNRNIHFLKLFELETRATSHSLEYLSDNADVDFFNWIFSWLKTWHLLNAGNHQVVTGRENSLPNQKRTFSVLFDYTARKKGTFFNSNGPWSGTALAGFNSGIQS